MQPDLPSFLCNSISHQLSQLKLVSKEDQFRIFWSQYIEPHRPLAASSPPPVMEAFARCSMCGGRLHSTPSGLVCPDGHGGTDVQVESVPKDFLTEVVVPDWTPSQAVALVKIENWLTSIKSYRTAVDGQAMPNRTFTLRGFPGTGKSFMQRYIKEKWEDDLNIVFAAPTHQACTVLSGYVKAKVSTLASLLGVKATHVEDRLVFELPERLPDLPAFTIVVVDESSQLNKQYVGFLERLCEELNVFVLYVGDHAQLNPIGERISKVWKLNKGTEFEATLTDIRRNAGPGLPMLAALRRCIFKKEYVNPVSEFHDGTCIFVHPTERKFLRSVRDDLKAFESGEAKLIAWRNRRVQFMASFIRELLGYHPDHFSLGERFTLEGTFLQFHDLEEGEYGNNGEDVILVGRQDSMFNLERDVQSILPEWSIPALHVEHLLLESPSSGWTAAAAYIREGDPSEAIMKRLYGELAARARALADEDRKAGNFRSWRSRQAWDIFWKLKRSFVSLRSAYTATSHTFQGSEMKTVYVDSQDILANPNSPEAFRCLYTAASRFKETVHFM